MDPCHKEKFLSALSLFCLSRSPFHHPTIADYLHVFVSKEIDEEERKKKLRGPGINEAPAMIAGELEHSEISGSKKRTKDWMKEQHRYSFVADLVCIT